MKISQKGKMGLNILTIVTMSCVAHNFVTFYGGMGTHDLLAAVLGVLVLAEQDDVTVAINGVLSHAPGPMNFLGFCSVGMYVIHMLLFQWIIYAVDTGTYTWMIDFLKSLGNIHMFALFCFAVLLLVCIPLYYFDKKVRAGMTNWVLRITKANEPIIFEEKETVTA